MVTHGFPDREFEARLVRAQRLMDAAHLDAVLVTTPPNIRYFTGFDSQFYESPTRPWFIIVPRVGDIFAVIPEIGAPQMAETWVIDINAWPAPQPHDDGVTLLAATLSTLENRYGRIGAELGREMALRMPIIEFERMRDAVKGFHIVDGSPCLWSMRMVKTEAEIDRIRVSCQIASNVYARVPELVKIGDTEREAARKVRVALAEAGADSTPFLPAISGPGGVPQIVCGPGDRVLAEGDILFFDTGSTFDGYFCDFDRNYAVGDVDDAALHAHEACWKATEAGIAAARPGATTHDIFKAMMSILEAAGSLGNNVGRLGHGLGLQLTEPPSHMPGDETAIVEHMVLTIEPGLEYAPGKMIVHEENIVVRGGSPELLTTRAPRELLRITS